MASKAPDPPRRPPTAYMMFTADNRARAKEDHPHSSFGALGKILGEMWSKLPEAQKNNYKDQASEAMKEYKQNFAQWKDDYPAEAKQMNEAKKRKRDSKAEKKKKKSKRQKKDPNAPKRAMSAFMFYSQEHRASIQDKNPGVTFGQIGRILGAEWKKLSEADREKYNKKAEEDRERYKKESEKYKSNRTQEPEVESSSSESEDNESDDE